MKIGFEYLKVPAVIRGNHAVLLAKDGRRLCRTGIHLNRIGEVSAEIRQKACWREWASQIPSQNAAAAYRHKSASSPWFRKAAMWTSSFASRLQMQRDYKGGPRIHDAFTSTSWPKAGTRMLKQFRNKAPQRRSCVWMRWAQTTANNSSKRGAAHARRNQGYCEKAPATG